MQHTFLEKYAKTFQYPYGSVTVKSLQEVNSFEKTLLGKRKIRSHGMSSDLAFNMKLYFDGFQPDEVL